MSDLIQPWHIIVLTVLFCVYIFPLSVAMHRKCKATNGIGVVNMLLGWTFIGWVVALAWAACGEKKLAAEPPRALTLDEEKLAAILLARMAANRPPAA